MVTSVVGHSNMSSEKVLQGLFFVPQVRESVAKLNLPSIEGTIPRDTPGGFVFLTVNTSR